MAGTGKRMRAGMGETMEAAATRAANAHLFILSTPVLKGGGYNALDAAVEAANNNQPLVWKGWWDSHLYAGRCKNVYILQIKICGVKRHNNKNI